MYLRFNCKHRKLADGIWAKEPIIPITIIGKDCRADFTAVLDSGSDFFLVSQGIADALQIDYSGGTELKSETFEGQEFKTKITTINFEIKKGRETIRGQCKAAISINGPDYPNIILGSSFFEHFEIIFDYPNNKFIIKSK